MPGVKKITKLEKELATILNCYSEENRSDTPDWILANYLIDCLDSFNRAMFSREVWYNRVNPDGQIKKLQKSREEAPEFWNPPRGLIN